MEDPKVCVTTSRDPSSRLKMFIKEIKLIIPNAQRVNRGASKLDEVPLPWECSRVVGQGVPCKRVHRYCHRQRASWRANLPHRVPSPLRPHGILQHFKHGDASRHRERGDDERGVPAPHLQQHDNEAGRAGDEHSEAFIPRPSRGQQARAHVRESGVGSSSGAHR